MHICFLNLPIEYYSPVSGGAIATIIMEMSRCLIAAGHTVTVLTPATKDEQYPVGNVIPLHIKVRDDLNFVQRRIAGLERRIFRWDWPYYGYYHRAFTRALRQLTPMPDAVIAFNDLVSQKYIRHLLPKARIYSWLQNEWRTCQWDLREILSATDRFLTCSNYIRKWTSEKHYIPLDKFSVLLSGIDPARFFPRENYLASASPLRVLFIGRIDPNKGPDLAVDAVKKLRDEGLRVEMSVAGGLWFYNQGGKITDPYFRSLKEKMDSAGVNYLGHVTRDKVPALIREHDVTCVLSRSNEPFGLVVLEAMASGCAVISSDRGGLPEACGDAGILVNPDHFEEIVDHLRVLATQPDQLIARKKQSIARAAASPWSAIAARLLDIIHDRAPEPEPSSALVPAGQIL